MTKYRTADEARREFLRLAKQHGFGDYRVDIVHRSVRKRAIATCNPYNRRFELTEFYAIHLTPEHLTSVILHEIAHAMTPGHGHDLFFKRACRRIGAIETRQGNFDYITLDTLPVHLKPKIALIYVCPACGKESTAGRKWTRKKSCGRCSPVYDERYLLVPKRAL